MDETSLQIINRIRVALSPWQPHIKELKMFGGICFMYHGKMCVGEVNHQLMVRVIAEKMDSSLAQPHVSPMDFTGKPMKEYVFVSPEGFRTEEELQHWIELGIEHARLKSKN